jgi:hypothetical protein
MSLTAGKIRDCTENVSIKIFIFSSRRVLSDCFDSECKIRNFLRILVNYESTERRHISEDLNSHTNKTSGSVEKQTVFLTASASINCQKKTWHYKAFNFTVINIRFFWCWVLINIPITRTKMVFNYIIHHFYTSRHIKRNFIEWIYYIWNWRMHFTSNILSWKVSESL